MNSVLRGKVNMLRFFSTLGLAISVAAILPTSAAWASSDSHDRLSVGHSAVGSAAEFQESFYENLALSARGQRFESLTIANEGPGSAEVTLATADGKRNKYAGQVHKDGTIIVDDKKACGALDGYNFVASVIHDAPGWVGETSMWKSTVRVQFAVGCNTVSIPVTIRVGNASGDVLSLVATGRVTKDIVYEGSPSCSSLDLHLHMIFLHKQFVQFDGTADDVLDSVHGHSAWTLAVPPRPDISAGLRSLELRSKIAQARF
jgi:hypothetical protein